MPLSAIFCAKDPLTKRGLRILFKRPRSKWLGRSRPESLQLLWNGSLPGMCPSGAIANPRFIRSSETSHQSPASQASWSWWLKTSTFSIFPKIRSCMSSIQTASATYRRLSLSAGKLASASLTSSLKSLCKHRDREAAEWTMRVWTRPKIAQNVYVRFVMFQKGSVQPIRLWSSRISTGPKLLDTLKAGRHQAAWRKWSSLASTSSAMHHARCSNRKSGSSATTCSSRTCEQLTPILKTREDQ